jgi:hypothetical protein
MASLAVTIMPLARIGSRQLPGPSKFAWQMLGDRSLLPDDLLPVLSKLAESNSDGTSPAK